MVFGKGLFLGDLEECGSIKDNRKIFKMALLLGDISLFLMFFT